MAKMTAAQRAELSRRAKENWAKRKAAAAETTGAPVAVMEAPAPVELDPKEQVQCVYCGTYFERQNVGQHQVLMHKGDMPTEEPALPARSRNLAAGAIIRSEAPAGQRGVPMKVPWTKNLLEKGWECNDPGCRDPEKPGWRYVPAEGVENPLCEKCGGPMHKLSRIVEWDAPPNAPHMVVWQKLEYHITPDATNRLPDIIVGQARASLDEDRRNRLPNLQMTPEWEGQAGRLRTAGLLPPLEAEETAAAGS